MQEISNFIVNNWKFIIIAIISLCSFILQIFFKRTKLVDNSLVYHLLSWIDVAEHKFKLGEDKKSYVLDEAKKYLGDDFKQYEISKLIEYVLSLPQKKG